MLRMARDSAAGSAHEVLQRRLSVGAFCVELIVQVESGVELHDGDQCRLVSIHISWKRAIRAPHAFVEDLFRHPGDEILKVDVEGFHVVERFEPCPGALQEVVVHSGEPVEGVAELRFAMQPQRAHPVEHPLAPASVAGPVRGAGHDPVDAVASEIPIGGHHFGYRVAGVDDVVDVAVIPLCAGQVAVVFRKKACWHFVAIAIQVALAHLDAAAEERAHIVAFLVGNFRGAVIDGVFDDVAGGEVRDRAAA